MRGVGGGVGLVARFLDEFLVRLLLGTFLLFFIDRIFG